MFLTILVTVAACFISFAIEIVALDSSGSAGDKISVRLQDDNKLELDDKCICVGYYQCEEINDFKIVGGAGLFVSQRRKCLEDPNYRCCNNAPKDEYLETVGTTTEKPSIDDVKIKNIATNTSCGRARTVLTGRILNPETDSATTILGEHPWLVEIFEKTGNKKAYRFLCAGSLIHPRVVLTVLHYVKSSNKQFLKVVATGKEVFQNLGENPDNERSVLKIVKHPEYYSGGLYNDIALIILQSDFLYSNYPINSICLPRTNQVFDGKRCLVVGWGENRDHANIPLKKVDVPILDFDECQNLLRKTRLGSGFSLHESFLCAGGEEGKDTCYGDGGSPLICSGDDDNYIQAGIVSWGLRCGVVNEPGLYTNVAQFKDWIVEELRNNDIEI